MTTEYKDMSTDALEGILRQYLADINAVMHQITEGIPYVHGASQKAENNKSRQSYARIKDSLKFAYHYTSLSRNYEPMNKFYSHCFSPAVHEAYVHCRAKSNEVDTDKILASLYEAHGDIEYYLPQK